jgi:hypothetical protein
VLPQWQPLLAAPRGQQLALLLLVDLAARAGLVGPRLLHIQLTRRVSRQPRPLAGSSSAGMCFFASLLKIVAAEETCSSACAC